MLDDEAMPQGKPGGPAGMTIEAFCRARGLSRSRVDRTAREIGWRAVAEQEDVPPHGADKIDLKAVHLGPTERKGLRVESRGGNERFSYEVARPEAFFEHLAEEHGADLLTDQDVRRLLRYGKFLRDVIEGEAGYQLRMDQFYDGERPDKDEMLEELEALLRKAGWDPEREEAPPSS
jgi:hypothetical protein